MLTPFLTTGIGSMPHTNPDEACRLVLETFDIPFWPQLPKLSFLESMIPQYSEGIPSLRINEAKETVYIQRDEEDSLMQFYEHYSNDWKCAISEKYSQGIYSFVKILKDRHFQFLKGQTTGPLTLTLGIKDSNGRLIYFDEELREISLLVLNAKIKWQIEFLKPYANKIILFIDEPILSAIGTSAYLGVNSDDAIRMLKETSGAIRKAGGIPGIHCCGKADWPFVINSDVDIISFDAYDYVETISLYPEEFTKFLENGGYLAWGIIPTTDSIKDENVDSIKKRFDTSLRFLSKNLPAVLLLSNILLTPSCGTGSRNVEETIKIFKILKELKKIIKEDP
ncbi:MAG: hypothetical protein HXY53_09085 [Nitrospirae bacterium]|nr:hypothetical protein [Nitrospirota bacterium]